MTELERKVYLCQGLARLISEAAYPFRASSEEEIERTAASIQTVSEHMGDLLQEVQEAVDSTARRENSDV